MVTQNDNSARRVEAPRKRCRWLEDISDAESHCSKGYPPDVRCWSGIDNPCWAYMADLPHLVGEGQ